MSDLPIYDEAEAVCFVCAWTGLDETVVQPVLSARGRYLQLSGLGEGEEDEALIRERGAVAHLLPAAPGLIDNRELIYLCLATNLPMEIILRIHQGDLAYMDQLGIMAWTPEERDRSLGAPHLNSQD